MAKVFAIIFVIVCCGLIIWALIGIVQKIKEYTERKKVKRSNESTTPLETKEETKEEIKENK